MGLVMAACSAPAAGPDETLRGAQVEVLAVWSSAEQERFERVLEAFEQETGVTVVYTSAGHGVPSALAARLSEGRPPDLAFVPQPGLLRRYAAEGVLVPVDAVTAGEVRRNFGGVWTDLASLDGRLYGVPFKAANKSLVWYDVASFERAGVVPPRQLPGLREVAGRLASAGVPAFSVGGADGWTLTDWFENLYLRTAGAQRYDLLVDHRIRWTDDSVTTALALLIDLLRPEHLAGGVDNALATKFTDSVASAFTKPAAAGMVFEGDFVAGVISSRTSARLGVDVDVFAFPAVAPSDPGLVGGGDIAVLMRRSAAGSALLRYLASPRAAQIWASAGGFISPNLNVDLSAYPDEISRVSARGVLDAGDGFRFDLSDLVPASFGGTEGQGMRKRLQDLVRTRDVASTAALLEADAMAAYGR